MNVLRRVRAAEGGLRISSAVRLLGIHCRASVRVRLTVVMILGADICCRSDALAAYADACVRRKHTDAVGLATCMASRPALSGSPI